MSSRSRNWQGRRAFREERKQRGRTSISRLRRDNRRSHTLLGGAIFGEDFRIGIVIGLIALIALVWWLIYAFGGAKPPVIHLVYLPVVYAAILLGSIPGIATAVVVGVAVGPLTPLDVVSSAVQEPELWIFRTVMLVVVAGSVGLGISFLRGQIALAHYLGEHDLETGLPNMTALENRLASLLGRGETSMTMIAVEPRNLAEITMTLGFRAIPRLFETLAERIRQEVRSLAPAERTEVYHHHPHRLSIVIEDGRRELVTEIAESISRLSRTSFELEGIDLYLDLAVGLASPRPDDTSEHTLIHRSDVAIHYAKDTYQSVYRYDLGIGLLSRETLAILGELTGALERDSLLLHFQPKVDLRTLEVVGVEALIRWMHPTEGLLLPGRFIPQAEKTNLIREITSWVLDQSVASAASWGLEAPLSVAVNVSLRNLEDHEFASQILDVIERHGWDPSRLEIEITESMLMKHPARTIEILRRIRDIRCVISIDDFGTGYSSLAYLGMLPATTIKIDRHFVKDIEHDPGARHIVDATIDLAHSFGMNVVAEGIETEPVFEYLRSRGCEIGQGYYFARPLPERELLSWMRSRVPLENRRNGEELEREGGIGRL